MKMIENSNSDWVSESPLIPKQKFINIYEFLWSSFWVAKEYSILSIINSLM